jgi:hypothetical protein
MILISTGTKKLGEDIPGCDDFPSYFGPQVLNQGPKRINKQSRVRAKNRLFNIDHIEGCQRARWARIRASKK